MSKKSLNLSESLTLKPSSVPTNPEPGQIYLDENTLDLKRYEDGVWKTFKDVSNLVSPGTAGWQAGSYTAATRPTGNFTATPAGLTVSEGTSFDGTTPTIIFTKAAGNQQGSAVIYEIDLPPAPNKYNANVLTVGMDYVVNSGTFTAGSNTTDSDLIYYVEEFNGSTWAKKEPSFFELLTNSTTVVDKSYGTFQVNANTTKIRFIAYVASTTTNAFSIKASVGLGEKGTTTGSFQSDWIRYTPTFGAGIGTATNINISYKIDGDSILIRGRFTTGTVTSGDATVSLPPGITLADFGAQVVGSGWGQNVTGKDIFVTTPTATALNFIANNGAGGSLNGTALGSSSIVDFYTSPMKVAGLSSNMKLSDGYEGRDIALSVEATGQSITNSGADVQVTSFGTPSLDTVSGFSSNSYTVKTSGIYDIYHYTSFNAPATAGTIIVRMKINGSTVVNFGANSGVAAFAAIGNPIKRYLKAGDVLTFFVNNASGGALTIDVARVFIEKSASPATIAASGPVVFSAVRTAGNFTIASGAVATYIANNVAVDTHAGFNSSTGVYTIPVSGLYEITFSPIVFATVSGGYIQPLIQSSRYSSFPAFYPTDSTNGNYRTVTVSRTRYFTAGDTITPRIYTLGAGTITVIGGDSTLGDFSIKKVN